MSRFFPKRRAGFSKRKARSSMERVTFSKGKARSSMERVTFSKGKARSSMERAGLMKRNARFSSGRACFSVQSTPLILATGYSRCATRAMPSASSTPSTSSRSLYT